MTMDVILQLPPGLPPHDAAPFNVVPAETIAQWPAGTFVENLAVLADGAIVVSVLSEARLDHVTTDGAVTLFHQFTESPPTGLALDGGALYAAVGEPGVPPMVLWRFDPASGEGEPWLTVEGAVFLNGLTRFAPGVLLSADSYQGALYRIDLAARTASVWFRHELLMRAPSIDFLPGANGIKRFGDHVYVSSNGRALFTRVALESDNRAGRFEVIAQRVRIDDFAFDAFGNAYVTTHISHGVDRIAPDGARATIGGPDQGLAGSTACAFGRTEGDRTSLYVTTTGGIVMPPGGVLQPAKLVRLAVGVAGAAMGEA
jgi:hypothetical protein